MRQGPSLTVALEGAPRPIEGHLCPSAKNLEEGTQRGAEPKKQTWAVGSPRTGERDGLGAPGEQGCEALGPGFGRVSGAISGGPLSQCIESACRLGVTW